MTTIHTNKNYKVVAADENYQVVNNQYDIVEYQDQTLLSCLMVADKLSDGLDQYFSTDDDGSPDDSTPLTVVKH